MFNGEADLRVHEPTHYKNICEFCGLEFVSRGELRQHMRIKHRILREDWAQITSADNSVLERTNSVIQNTEEQILENSHHCNICNATFNSKNEMKIHRKNTHITFKPCGDIDNCHFQTECFYSHDPIPKGMFRCYQCGEESISLSNMMNHRKLPMQIQNNVKSV